MRWRIRADVILADEQRARLLFNFVKGYARKAETIRRGTPAEERSWAQLEQCRHDEEPPQPCEVIQRVESE